MDPMEAQTTQPDTQKQANSGQGKETQALKAEYVDWLFLADPGKGTQAAWAQAHGLHPTTVSQWRNHDEFVLGLIAEQEQVIEKRWALVIRRQEVIALTGKPVEATAAATFLAKTFGRFKAEKLDLNVTGEKFLALQSELVAIRKAASEQRPN